MVYAFHEILISSICLDSICLDDFFAIGQVFLDLFIGDGCCKLLFDAILFFVIAFG